MSAVMMNTEMQTKIAKSEEKILEIAKIFQARKIDCSVEVKWDFYARYVDGKPQRFSTPFTVLTVKGSSPFRLTNHNKMWPTEGFELIQPQRSPKYSMLNIPFSTVDECLETLENWYYIPKQEAAVNV